MFHKAIDLNFLDGTALAVTFQDGKVKRYDMRCLFSKYPQLKALEDRELFLSGKLMGAYGIVWNDELDIEAETVYEDGETVRVETGAYHGASAKAVAAARAQAGLSQKELAERTGIDQSDHPFILLHLIVQLYIKYLVAIAGNDHLQQLLFALRNELTE